MREELLQRQPRPSGLRRDRVVRLRLGFRGPRHIQAERRHPRREEAVPDDAHDKVLQIVCGALDGVEPMARRRDFLYLSKARRARRRCQHLGIGESHRAVIQVQHPLAQIARLGSRVIVRCVPEGMGDTLRFVGQSVLRKRRSGPPHAVFDDFGGQFDA